jgi:hypothetical protein
MEERYAIFKVRNEDGNLTYELVNLGFLTPLDAYSFRNQELGPPENYIIVRYFC